MKTSEPHLDATDRVVRITIWAVVAAVSAGAALLALSRLLGAAIF